VVIRWWVQRWGWADDGRHSCQTIKRRRGMQREPLHHYVTVTKSGYGRERLDLASLSAQGPPGFQAPLVHTVVCVTMVCMAQVDRLSVTMPPEVGAAVRDSAARQGTSVSNWLAAAASQRLRNELLGAALDAWEAEDGPFSESELNAAVTALGRARRGTT
jgi:hypothetical protein